MRTSEYSEEQIIGFLKQVEAGVPVKDVCRKGGFSDATFYLLQVASQVRWDGCARRQAAA
jgi:putative transposase